MSMFFAAVAALNDNVVIPIMFLYHLDHLNHRLMAHCFCLLL